MKKTALAVILVSVLLISAVAEIESVGLAWANPFSSYTAAPDVKLYSPLNETYAGSVPMSFTVFASMYWVRGDDNPEIYQELESVDYYIDGSFQDSIVATSKLIQIFRYSANLTGLCEGGHCLVVETVSTGVTNWGLTGWKRVVGDSATVTVYFSIADDGIPPKISLLSAENKTYPTTNITLTYSINDQVVKALCSLDGQENKRLSGNTTLTNLSEGSHNITVHAYDRVGNEVSETVYFTVSVPKPFPTTLLIGSAIVVVVAVVGLGLLVYFKKRHGDKN